MALEKKLEIESVQGMMLLALTKEVNLTAMFETVTKEYALNGLRGKVGANVRHFVEVDQELVLENVHFRMAVQV